MLVDELQAVPVAGGDDAVPAGGCAFLPHRADDVVRLPALAGEDGDIHGPQHILHHGHLLGQLVRHAVAGGLVLVVLLVAEGGAVEIEGHAQGVRRVLVLQPLHDIQKSVDGMGIEPLPGGQGPHAEIGAVDDAVAVEDHQLHDGSLR